MSSGTRARIVSPRVPSLHYDKIIGDGLHNVVQLSPEVSLEDPLLLAAHADDDLRRSHKVVRPAGEQ